MTQRRADDPAQADRAWSGYHPRSAIPAVAVAAVASLVVWTGRWYQTDLRAFADRVGALAVYAPVWCVWLVLITAYLYRAVTYSYRLTDRAVLVDFGFWFAPVPPVWLEEVSEVRAGAGWIGRLFGVGWIELRAVGRAVRLVGVRHPEELAGQIRSAVTACRTG
jgi:hypothetical protein